MKPQRAALLERHGSNMWDWTHPERCAPNKYKLVILAEGQSEDFDGKAGREWLWPHLGRAYHLVAFVDVVQQ
jgi:hypothetical protein